MLVGLLLAALCAATARGQSRTFFVGDVATRAIFLLPLGAPKATIAPGYVTPTNYLGAAASGSQVFVLRGLLDRFAVDVLTVNCNASLTLTRTVSASLPGAFPDWWLVDRPQAVGDVLYLNAFDFKVRSPLFLLLLG